jgi:hypothetical protein
MNVIVTLFLAFIGRVFLLAWIPGEICMKILLPLGFLPSL